MWGVEVGKKKLSDVKKGQERQKGCTLRWCSPFLVWVGVIVLLMACEGRSKIDETAEERGSTCVVVSG